MKKIITVLLTIIMICSTLSTTSLAAEYKEFNYIYVDSEEDIDWSSLTNMDIVVISNSCLDYDSDEVVHQLVETPTYLDTEETQSRGTTKPNLSTFLDISSYGRYTFSGDAPANSTGLYTNYNFKGCDEYRVQISNYASTELTVQFRGALFTHRTETLPAGTTYILFFDSVGSNTKWHLYFHSPCDVYGYVEEY